MKLLLLVAFLISIWTCTIGKRHRKNKYLKFDGNDTDDFNQEPSFNDTDSAIHLDLKGDLRKLFFVLSAESKPESNTLCSPISAILPLAKLALGAQGDSLKELLSAIGVRKREMISKQFKPLLLQLRYLPGVRLDIASRLYVSQNARLNRKFVDLARDIFENSAAKIDFNFPTYVAEEINAWVSSQTNGIIKDMFEPTDISPSSSLVLVNAVYFNGRWETPFESVKIGTFHTTTSQKTIQMMSLNGEFNYTSSEALGSQVISIPYSGGRASLVLVLPLSRTGLPPLLHALRLAPWMLRAVFDEMTHTRVHITMPKFSVTSELDLATAYKKLGLKTIFDANLSGLLTIVRDEKIFISNAKHKCYIEVNEYGTEAAAASGTVLMKLSPSKPIDFHADHPFLYFIMQLNEKDKCDAHSRTGVVIPDVDSNGDTNRPLDLLASPNEAKDYFLPPVFPHTDDVDEDDDEEEDHSYLDYDYDHKEINYKDSPDIVTVKSDYQEVLPIDDKIPLHTAKDNLPVFLLEPENTYVVKNKPATLKCRAANALEVYFKCNGIKTEALNFEFVDPQTGVRIIEGEYKVTREQVEEYFGTEKYQCSCFAWTSRGQIRSQPATIELAYIKKHFSASPQSQLVKQYSAVTFRCEAPPAAPFAQVYWLKNGAPIAVDDNVHINKEGDLVIKQASLLDMANYTCVAENLAGKRLSEPALLTVFVNGGWSSWSTWSECSCAGGGRRRERTCTHPRPLNGGQPCSGPAVQRTPECTHCELDVYMDSLDELADESPDVVLGHWSQWSEWSSCDTDCLRSRRRRCVSGPCRGRDAQLAPCPLCVRTANAHAHGASYWPLLIALSIAFLIFVVVVVLGIKYMKMKIAENSPYVKPPPGTNYFGNVIKRTLTNQPDLTIHEEFHTMDSRRTNRQTNSINNRNEHLYEVPQLANSYIAPLDHEVRNHGVETFACKDKESDRSDSSCFLSSGSSYGNESVEMSPSLKNNASVNSKFLNCQYLETATSKIVNGDGDWLNLDKCGVRLYIPDGVVEKGEELFSIEVTDEEWNKPLLQEGETQLSPIIRCGPKNVHFCKAMILTFPHCVALKNSSWILSILQKPEEINCREWRKVLTLGQETPGSPIFAQVDPLKVYIVCEFLSDFVLIGRSFNALDAKLLKVALFLGKRSDGYYNLHVHAFHDTPYALYECFESERRTGGLLLCDPKTIYFQENCSDLCVNVRDVGVGWKIQSGNKYQELPFAQLWNMNVRSLHCLFVLQQVDAINCLDLNVTVYQKQRQSNSVNFNLKTNDFNSNLNCNKRFSYSGVEIGYSVNILENPFNYSSLSKKEARYDFVYRNSLRRNSYSLDNNCYRTNVLTKSDRVILCKLLDCQTTKGNDWRLLAEKLKLTSFYYYFSNTCSPTENILNLWLCRNNDVNMLISLSRVFREMSRIDCATVIERRCFPN
ncbi:unc-5 [Danaus plexippus plexippus]|uniref:Netrin receptor UNC5 n=1 Tax=Danaus plexippus plexippus TaxID=278856 RepID=A0A212EZX5_DANPL|nr:unc-5 [Danaus plexippus plexippus]